MKRLVIRLTPELLLIIYSDDVPEETVEMLSDMLSDTGVRAIVFTEAQFLDCATRPFSESLPHA